MARSQPNEEQNREGAHGVWHPPLSTCPLCPCTVAAVLPLPDLTFHLQTEAAVYLAKSRLAEDLPVSVRHLCGCALMTLKYVCGPLTSSRLGRHMRFRAWLRAAQYGGRAQARWCWKPCRRLWMRFWFWRGSLFSTPHLITRSRDLGVEGPVATFRCS